MEDALREREGLDSVLVICSYRVSSPVIPSEVEIMVAPLEAVSYWKTSHL